MKLITFVLIGMVAIVAYLASVKPKFENKVAQTDQVTLKKQQAKFIYDYLAKKGIDKKRMKYVGMRRKFPLGGEPKFDRRVEILVTYVGATN